ncbi:MAG: pyridoxal phosphate-dependent aminotransferase [Chitinophagales bacterium]
MPKISSKGISLPNSPIRKLSPYAEQAKARGIHIYHLNIGQPDIKTPQLMLDAARNIDFSVLAYGHSAGEMFYRKKLQTYYQRRQIDLDIPDILVTAGASEAMLFAFSICLDEGDELVVPEPFYANYHSFAAFGGGKIVPIPSSIDSNFSLPPIEDFEQAITSKTRAILICNPSNPTGYLYSEAELNVLKTLAIKYDLFLIVDEVYREFVYDGGKHTSILNIEGLEEHAIVLDSISKRYSACGARIGALVSRNQTFLQTVMKLAQARLSPSIIAQRAAAAAVDLPDTYFEDTLKEYQNRRDTLIACLQKIPGVKCATPKGAFYVMAALPVEDTEHFCQWLLEDFNYQGETVMFAPASGFYATEGMGRNEIRIAYILNQQDLRKAMLCLEKALEVYKKRAIDS